MWKGTSSVNEEQWEMEVEDFFNDEQDAEWTMADLDTVDEGQPPQVDEETMKEIEAAAGQEEISRLLTMGVIREPTHQEVEQGEILTTRSVYDWRFRDGKWKRRCRFVAREFKGNDVSSSKTFAPTSSIAATRLVLGTHVILKSRDFEMAPVFLGHQRCFSVGGGTTYVVEGRGRHGK